MKKKGLIMTIIVVVFAAVMGLAACNGNGGNGDTTPVQYTVTFETDGGSTVAAMTVDDSDSIDLPALTKTNFTFDGWFDNADLNGDRLSSPYTPTANVTLYAKWEAIVETDKKHFTFEEIKGNSDAVIGYSVTFASGTVPSNINVPISYNSKPVFTVKRLANANVKEITVPDTVTEIESGAFSGCSSLTSVTIGSGVTSIDDMAFFRSEVLEVHITDLAAWCSVSFGDASANPLDNAHNLYMFALDIKSKCPK